MRLLKPKKKRGANGASMPASFILIMATTFSTTFVARQLLSSTDAAPRRLLLENYFMDAPSNPASSTNGIVKGFSRVFASVASYNTPVDPVQELPGARAFARVESHNAPSRGESVLRRPTPPPTPIDYQNDRFVKYNTTYQYTAPDTSLVPPTSECGSGPAFEDFFKLPGSVRSRYQEDQFIYQRFFQNKLLSKTSGTYVELGAFDGLMEANTRFFDHCLGWKGLLIEGNPTTYQKTQRNRPHAHRMSFAPSCSAEYEAVNKTVEFAKYPMTNSGLKGKAKTYDAKPMVAVPCGPLTPVLQDIFPAGQHINFFSLDVEGAEPMVLRTIDFDAVHIDVLMIEVENDHCPKRRPCAARQEVRAIMKEAGYRRYEGLVLASDVYVRPDSEFVLPDLPFSDH